MHYARFLLSKLKNIMTSKAFIFSSLAILFISIFLFVVIGIIYRSGDFNESLKPGGLLDGLIANGISIILSVILISPLTAIFISLIRERQLKPIRRISVITILTQIERLSTSYIHQAPIYGNAVLALGNALEIYAISGALNSFNEYVTTLHNKLPTALTSLAPEHNDRGEPATDTSVFNNIKRDANLVRGITNDIYRVFYNETLSIDNTITFAMPILPPECTESLYEIRKQLIEYRGSLQDVFLVLSGSSDPRIISNARLAVINFTELVRLIDVIANKIGIKENISIYTPSVISNGSLNVVFQHEIMNKLVDILIYARKYDDDNEKIRQG